MLPSGPVSVWGPPVDSLNGIIVGATQSTFDGSGALTFNTVSAANPANPIPSTTLPGGGTRSFIDLVAPGDSIRVPQFNDPAVAGANTAYPLGSPNGTGTSDAAAQLTGALALLQQYANERGWGRLDPAVWKAILMNSADKVQDSGDGLNLDMEKTITRSDRLTWNAGNLPLDPQIGAGALNVRRALNQLSSGQVLLTRPAPPIGWGLGMLFSNVNNDFDRIVLAQPLKGGSKIAVTLTWERPVSLQAGGTSYTAGASFVAPPLQNLELYVMPRGATNLNQAVASMHAPGFNVQQIFATIPADGQYEIWVRRTGTAPNQGYALAWWTDPIAQETPYQVSGRVWQDTNGNGIQDPREPGVQGVPVYLYKADGTYVGMRTSSGIGTYIFANLQPGTYYLSFVQPTGMRWTTPNVGNNSDLDSDVISVGGLLYGLTSNFTVGPSGNAEVDAGLLRAGAVGGNAWLDSSRDGIYTSLDAAVSGVAVSLFTSDGVRLGSSTTDDNGSYTFSDLDAGSYYVEFTTPSGLQFTKQDQGTNGEEDSDADPTTGDTADFSVVLNSEVADVDAGFTSTPVARDDEYSVAPDETLTVAAATGVLENDTNEDGSSLTAELVSGTSNGSFVLNSDGSFTYTPNSGFWGDDTFTYMAQGAESSDTATVTITVTPAANSAPVASSDTYSTPENKVLSVSAKGVLANDSDADGDPLTASLVAAPTNGSITLNSDGSFSYTPNTGFTGSDTFTYQANDGVQNSNVATVTITVSAGTGVPVANDDNYSVSAGQTLNVSAPRGVANYSSGRVSSRLSVAPRLRDSRPQSPSLYHSAH